MDLLAYNKATFKLLLSKIRSMNDSKGSFNANTALFIKFSQSFLVTFLYMFVELIQIQTLLFIPVKRIFSG